MGNDQKSLGGCVRMNKTSGRWSALRCDSNGLGFICEKKGKGCLTIDFLDKKESCFVHESVNKPSWLR